MPGASVKKVFAVMSGKGGVGKSMVTALLAKGMQERGYKAAVLDADITGPQFPDFSDLMSPPRPPRHISSPR